MTQTFNFYIEKSYLKGQRMISEKLRSILKGENSFRSQHLFLSTKENF